MGRRQASLGTPVPRTPTVAPGPKTRSGLASRRSEGPSMEHSGPPTACGLGRRVATGLDVGVSASPCCLGNCPTDKRLAWVRLTFIALIRLAPDPLPCSLASEISRSAPSFPFQRAMAPRKAVAGAPPAWYSPALDPPNMTEKNLVALQLMTAIYKSRQNSAGSDHKFMLTDRK